jgi:hypothetical protein
MDTSTFTGSGFQFLKSQLLQCSDRTQQVIEDHDDENCSNKNNTLSKENTTYLSKSAADILLNLLKEEKVNLTNDPSNVSASSQQRMFSEKKIVTPDMTDETKQELAYNHEISLMGSLLYVIDQSHQNYRKAVAAAAATTTAGSVSGSTGGDHISSRSAAVSTKSMLQQCAYTVIPQKTPALLSAREMVCAALHFLCQESPIPSSSSSEEDDTSALPLASPIRIQLPLIQSTSMPSDLERRSYEKAYDWNFIDILPQILMLENEFYSNFMVPSVSFSDSSTNQNILMWLPREFFMPDIKDDQMLRQIYIQGSIPSEETSDGKSTDTKKIKRAFPSKNVTPTAKSSSAGGSMMVQSIQMKRKQPSTTPLSTKETSVENTEREMTQKQSGTVIRKIKITLSSSKKKPSTPMENTLPMPPAHQDGMVATGTNQMLDANDDNDDEDEMEAA